MKVIDGAGRNWCCHMSASTAGAQHDEDCNGDHCATCSGKGQVSPMGTRTLELKSQPCPTCSLGRASRRAREAPSEPLPGHVERQVAEFEELEAEAMQDQLANLARQVADMQEQERNSIPFSLATLTPRDLYAAAALQAAMTLPVSPPPEQIPEMAFDFADAMMAEREKRDG